MFVKCRCVIKRSKKITPTSRIFEWCMVGYEYDNKHQKDACWTKLANIFNY